MPRRPEIGNVQLYPNRPLRDSDRNGYVLKFYCPLNRKRIRKNSGTRDRTEARRILRECRQRLLDGKYIESGGAISEALETREASSVPRNVSSGTSTDRTWDDCFEHYYASRKSRVREKSLMEIVSRLNIAKRILDGYRDDRGLPEETPVKDLMTLEAIEYLQDRLLAGDECRYDHRSPMTVNTTMAAIMAFVRHCHRHEWIEKVPHLIKLDVNDVMKGQPISSEEFEQMVQAVPDVVGSHAAVSWERVLRILWESAFRVGDVMNFSWDDDRKIRPLWPPPRDGKHPTIAIPSTQKNKKTQEIPMLPALQKLLEETPRDQRTGWIVNPLPVEDPLATTRDGFKPSPEDLAQLTRQHTNSAIARACGVSETAVRKWIKEAGIQQNESTRSPRDLKPRLIAAVRQRSEDQHIRLAQRSSARLTKEHVGRIISEIGEQTRIVEQQVDEEVGKRLKYSSAHDLRRGCAQRLINAGVSAETLKLVLRHKDFGTTERFYGATRAAQSAAVEIHERLSAKRDKIELVGGLEPVNPLTAEALRKLKALLNSI